MNERLGTLQIIEGRPVLRFERRLAHPPEKVWRAITDPAELIHWFPAEVRAELKVGARMEFSFNEPGVDATGFEEGEVLECDPPKVYAFRWTDSVLRFEIIPDGDGARLLFSHTFSGAGTWGDRAATARNAAGWDGCLAMLAGHLDGAPEAVPDDFWFRRAEQYIAEFGLAEGEISQTAEGYLIRFERDLTQPPQEVWDTLAEGGEVSKDAPPPARFAHGYLEAGPVTVAEPPHTLEYRSEDGLVRFELATQQPLGCRLVVTHAVPEAWADRRAVLLAAWQTQLELLFAALHGDDRRPWPTERTEHLTEMYATRL